MIIGSCGYGATGSSSVTDLLREYDEVQVFDDFEFTYTYCVDGVEDLEYHLMQRYAKGLSSDAAIMRFKKSAKAIKIPFVHKPMTPQKYLAIVDKYIESITQVSFKGMSTIDILYKSLPMNIVSLAMKKIILPVFVEKWIGKPCYFWPNRKMYLSVMPDNFYEASKEYIMDILKEMGADFTKTIVLDQPFEVNSPENSFKFFDNPKAILVDRDPRDLYLEAKYTLISERRFLPRENVKEFVEYYKRVRLSRPRESTDRILLVQFEDLVYRYNETVKIIEEFCDLGEHKRNGEIFNPLRSVNNTQLIRKYPQEKDNIQYIERELPEFLYPYENYKDIDTSGDVFVGSAKYMKNK